MEAHQINSWRERFDEEFVYDKDPFHLDTYAIYRCWIDEDGDRNREKVSGLEPFIKFIEAELSKARKEERERIVKLIESINCDFGEECLCDKFPCDIHRIDCTPKELIDRLERGTGEEN